MKLRSLVLAGLLPFAAGAQAHTPPAGIVQQLIDGADLGPSRGICIGSEEECRAGGQQSAQTGIDLLVTFDFDSAELSIDARAKLREIVVALGSEALKPHRFIIEGFTDAKGTEAHNLGLSERRAVAVRDFLLAGGIEPDRLSAVGKGASSFRTADPFDPINRRVELRLLAP